MPRVFRGRVFAPSYANDLRLNLCRFVDAISTSFGVKRVPENSLPLQSLYRSNA